jgi:hypothetical protein
LKCLIKLTQIVRKQCYNFYKIKRKLKWCDMLRKSHYANNGRSIMCRTWCNIEKKIRNYNIFNICHTFRLEGLHLKPNFKFFLIKKVIVAQNRTMQMVGAKCVALGEKLKKSKIIIISFLTYISCRGTALLTKFLLFLNKKSESSPKLHYANSRSKMCRSW